MRQPRPHENSNAEPVEHAPMPRWVKVFALIAVFVVAVFIIMILTGGDHTPLRHL